MANPWNRVWWEVQDEVGTRMGGLDGEREWVDEEEAILVANNLLASYEDTVFTVVRIERTALRRFRLDKSVRELPPPEGEVGHG